MPFISRGQSRQRLNHNLEMSSHKNKWISKYKTKCSVTKHGFKKPVNTHDLVSVCLSLILNVLDDFGPANVVWLALY